MERVRLNKRKVAFGRGKVVPSWKDPMLYADDIAVGNCEVHGELLVGVSLLAKDQSVICHIHFRSDIATAIYRYMGEAIMDAGMANNPVAEVH